MKGYVISLDGPTGPYRVPVHVCDSKDDDHQEWRLAVVRVHWPSGPIEYCEACAETMRAVARVLDIHVHEEALPTPVIPEARRGIELKREER